MRPRTPDEIAESLKDFESVMKQIGVCKPKGKARWPHGMWQNIVRLERMRNFQRPPHSLGEIISHPGLFKNWWATARQRALAVEPCTNKERAMSLIGTLGQVDHLPEDQRPQPRKRKSAPTWDTASVFGGPSFHAEMQRIGVMAYGIRRLTSREALDMVLAVTKEFNLSPPAFCDQQMFCSNHQFFVAWWMRNRDAIMAIGRSDGAAIPPTDHPKRVVTVVRKPNLIGIRSPRAMTAAQRDDFFASREWRELRYDVLRQLGAACACCGRSKIHGVVLHVDHIKPLWTHPELKLDPNNLQVLCEDCNIGKGAWDSTDWRGA